MNRMELLKLALSTTKDAREALALAREMAAFIRDAEPAPKPAVADAATAKKKGRPPGSRDKRERRPVTPADREKIVRMWIDGATWDGIKAATGRHHSVIGEVLKAAKRANGSGASAH